MLTYIEETRRNVKAIDEWRMGIVHVCPELIVSIATGTIECVEHNDVPEFCLLVDVHWIPEHRYFAVTVAHHSLAVVPEGDPIPELRGPTFKRDRQGRAGWEARQQTC